MYKLLDSPSPSPQCFTDRTSLPQQRDYLPPLVAHLTVLQQYNVAIAVTGPIFITHES